MTALSGASLLSEADFARKNCAAIAPVCTKKTAPETHSAMLYRLGRPIRSAWRTYQPILNNAIIMAIKVGTMAT